MNPDQIPLPDAIFATVRVAATALEAARARGPAPDGSHMVELPDEFALLRCSEGLTALRTQRNDLLDHVWGLHATVMELIHAAAGTEFGDLLSAKRPLSNPELLARLRETAVRIRALSGEPLRAARLLACYDTLGGLFHGAAEEVGRTAAWAATGPEPADAPEEMTTSPDDARQFGIPSAADAFEDMARALEQALAKPSGADGSLRVELPTSLKPRPYAEGMREVWALSERALRSAGELSPRLRDLCVTVIRTEIGEAAATGSPADGEFRSEVRVTGYAGTLILEEVCRTARQLGELPALSELLGGYKPTL